MTLRRTTTSLAVAILLAACATGGSTRWTKPGTSQQDLNAAVGRCRAQAMAAFPAPLPPPLAAAIQQTQYVNQCLIGEGWTRDLLLLKDPFRSRR